MTTLNTNMTLLRAEAELRHQYDEALTYAMLYGKDWEKVADLQQQLDLYWKALGMEPEVFVWRPRLYREMDEAIA